MSLCFVIIHCCKHILIHRILVLVFPIKLDDFIFKLINLHGLYKSIRLFKFSIDVYKRLQTVSVRPKDMYTTVSSRPGVFKGLRW